MDLSNYSDDEKNTHNFPTNYQEKERKKRKEKRDYNTSCTCCRSYCLATVQIGNWTGLVTLFWTLSSHWISYRPINNIYYYYSFMSLNYFLYISLILWGTYNMHTEAFFWPTCVPKFKKIKSNMITSIYIDAKRSDQTSSNHSWSISIPQKKNLQTS